MKGGGGHTFTQNALGWERKTGIQGRSFPTSERLATNPSIATNVDRDSVLVEESSDALNDFIVVAAVFLVLFG